jgi:hypothetical protein
MAEKGTGIVPAVGSAIVPGTGQLINGESDKALGVFAVWAVAGASFLGWIPILGHVAGAVAGVTWLYGVADGYFTGRKKGRP